MSKRRPLYSRSGKPRKSGGSAFARPDATPIFVELPPEVRGPTLRQRLGGWSERLYRKHQGKMLIATGALIALAIVGIYDITRPPIPRVDDNEFIADVNAVVDHRQRPPSLASLVYAKALPSVVRIAGFNAGQLPPSNDKWAAKDWMHNWFETIDKPVAIGTGVVIDDKGSILTNFHVAGAAAKLRVTYSDGTEADGYMIGGQPDHDLAVVRTQMVPDDLQPATLAASTSLHPGDEVVAIGFPFGIGPSVSDGIVSGLHRAFEDDHGHDLTDLIQFDAAANPGRAT